MATLIRGNTDFAVKVYQQLSAGSVGENVIFSPFSISIAVGMTYIGAKGSTANQIGRALMLNNAGNVKQAEFTKAILKIVQDYITMLKQKDSTFTLQIANRVYANAKSSLRDKYKKKVQKYYHAEVVSSDFEADPDAVTADINKWISDETNNKISKAIGDGIISKDTMLVLVSAIYFKGIWDHQFAAENTKQAPFWINDDINLSVDMMHQEEEFKYAVSSKLNAKVLELPYVSEKLSMFIILPNEVSGLKDLEQKLNAPDLFDIPSSLSSTKVRVSIPKFKIEENYDLSAALTGLGIKDMFDSDKADLTGIIKAKGLSVSSMLHSAVIEVNEEGTEAAASTEEVISLSAFKTEEFVANHPFIFFIRDNRTGAILFIGRLAKPPIASKQKDEL